jgi:PhnB protein
MTQKTIPYLTVKGAANAIAFYQKAFNATETTRMAAQDGKRVMHAALTINGGTVMLSDEFIEHGGPPAPSPGTPVGVAVAVVLDAPAQVDATYSRALAAGAASVMEPGDMFWGDRFAMLSDPFGHRWMLSAPLAKP